MKILHSIDDVDPIPLLPRPRQPLDTWFEIVRPALDPEADAGWLKAWVESKIVADKPPALTPAGQSVGEMLTFTPAIWSSPETVDDGTWVAMSEEPTEDGVYQLKSAVRDWEHFSRWERGQWHGVGGSADSAARSGIGRSDVAYDGSSTHWLKPSAPQPPGADAWIEITADSVLPDLKAGEYEWCSKDMLPFRQASAGLRFVSEGGGAAFYRRASYESWSYKP